MKLKNRSKFEISGLNQEKILNFLSKNVFLQEINRKSKTQTSFVCSYFDHKKVKKFLDENNIKIEKIQHFGAAVKLQNLFKSYGVVCAVVVFFSLFILQRQFVLQFDVLGVESLSKTEIVDFVNQNYSRFMPNLNTKEIEKGLVDKFDKVSFASCMIKGQTLVINIKEKVLPEQMYGEFSPIIAKNDGKITQINLISGTVSVKVGDFVRKGEVLVEPYTIDTSGSLKKVEAKAEILADVYYEAEVSHSEHIVEVLRTGRFVERNEIKLFGLVIYSYKEKIPYKMYEVEREDVKLNKNVLLPFTMEKVKVYELVENVVESKFEDVKDEFIEKARQKTLENIKNYDKIKEEFYNITNQADVTIVNYCIVIEENMGVYYDN